MTTYFKLFTGKNLIHSYSLSFCEAYTITSYLPEVFFKLKPHEYFKMNVSAGRKLYSYMYSWKAKSFTLNWTGL